MTCRSCALVSCNDLAQYKACATCNFSHHCLQVCKEAEISQIARQTQEMPATDYLTVVQKDMTGDFTTKLPDKK